MTQKKQPADGLDRSSDDDAAIITNQINRPKLPFPFWLPIVVGSLTGIALRLIFSGARADHFTAMNETFILLAPFAVGAVSVYVAEIGARRSWRYYLFTGALTNLLFVLGTMAILIEGLICVILIAPLFSAIGALGGLFMGMLCRTVNWPRHAAFSLALLPVALGALPSPAVTPSVFKTVQREITIPSDPGKIWQQLNNIQQIQPHEVDQAWMYRIGVPLPISGVTKVGPDGLVRQIRMGKAIHFEQYATEWKVDRYVNWRYRFSPDSFPAGALDEHVQLGGAYFDLLDTDYILTPLAPRSTKLTIRMRYRVSTDFNWYAEPIARFLVGNFEETILPFYRQRTLAAMSADATLRITPAN